MSVPARTSGSKPLALCRRCLCPKPDLRSTLSSCLGKRKSKRRLLPPPMVRQYYSVRTSGQAPVQNSVACAAGLATLIPALANKASVSCTGSLFDPLPKPSLYWPVLESCPEKLLAAEESENRVPVLDQPAPSGPFPVHPGKLCSGLCHCPERP